MKRTGRGTSKAKRKSGEDLYLHTRSRMMSRCGHWLTREQWEELGQMVRDKQGECILTQTGTRTIWRLDTPWAGEVYAVYQKPASSVCTVLTKWMVDQLLREAQNDLGHV